MKITTLRSPIIYKQFILGALALICGLFSSCATGSYQEPQRPSYSESQVSKWKSYLRVSPFSSDASPSSNSIRSKVSSELPGNYNDHIRQVANQVDNLAVAQRRYSNEVERITGSYEVSKRVAPGIGSAGYKWMRGYKENESIGDVFGDVLSRLIADGLVESNYRSQMQSAAVTILKPVLEKGKNLVLAENALTHDMRVTPTQQLTQRVQVINDDRYRQLLPGVWKEHLVWHKVWLFRSNGSYEWEFPVAAAVGASKGSGQWSINNGILSLSDRFGSTDYRISQDGKAVRIQRLDGKDKSKLTFVSSDSSAYRQLLRSIGGGNTRYNVRF